MIPQCLQYICKMDGNRNGWTDRQIDGLDSWMFFLFSCTANLCYTQRLEYPKSQHKLFKIISQCYQYIYKTY